MSRTPAFHSRSTLARPGWRFAIAALAAVLALLGSDPARALTGYVPVKGPKNVCAGPTPGPQVGSNGGWQFLAPGGTDYDLLVPPVAPLIGTGALSQTVTTPGSLMRAVYYNSRFAGVQLSLVLAVMNEISYAHLDVAPLSDDLPTYLLFIDLDGNGSIDDVLRFFPATNGCASTGAWATCSTKLGLYFGTVASADPDGNLGTPFTLAAYTTANPNARFSSSPSNPVQGFELGGGPIGAPASAFVDRLMLDAVIGLDGDYDDVVWDFEEDCSGYGGDADADCWCDSTDPAVLVRDNCPGLSNPLQSDTDLDRAGNECDNCPGIANASQADADGDGRGDACDNCPADANAGQEDTDGDALGDACDACPNDRLNDLDGDGLCANVDSCPRHANPGQEDVDGDGFGDACDTGDVYAYAGAAAFEDECGACGDDGPALGAQLYAPTGLAFDAAGNLYVADRYNHRVRKIDPAGTITTVAGNGDFHSTGDGGPATQAGILEPYKVAVDPAGTYLYVSEGTSRVRRVNLATNLIETFAGNGSEGFSGDGGPAKSASLNFPAGLAVTADTLYIADQGNLRVRAVDLATKKIRTVAGTGADAPSADGPPLSVPVPYPNDVAFAGGKLYVAEGGENGSGVRVIDFGANQMTRVAGMLGMCANDDVVGDGGSALAATVCFPEGITVDPAGNLYIADTGYHRVRKVSGGVITTVAGTGRSGFAGDNAPATEARYESPSAVAIAADGSIFVADTFNDRIRRIALCGNARTESGESCDDGPAPEDGDGCSAICRVEPLPPLTDPAALPGVPVAMPAPTETKPFAGAVTTPTGGAVSITVTGDTPSLPAGFVALGVGIDVEAPAASAAAPLELVFTFDASIVPQPPPFVAIDIFRDGVRIDDVCVGDGTAIPNDPCVKSRTRVAGDDVEIRVLSSHASEWAAGLPVCGDGVVQGGEACDDANLASGDGCSPLCAVERCFACSGSGPGSCAALPDTDGDGTCDAQDVCANPSGAFKAKPAARLQLNKIGSDPTPANDKLSVLGVFDLAPGQTFADVNPLANGARVVLQNRLGGTELDVTLLGGAYGGSGTRGWKKNGAGTKWQYVDKTTDGSLAGTYGGIEQLQILDRSKVASGEVMVKVRGKGGSYPVTSGDSPVNAVVVLGGTAAGDAGLCGNSTFDASACKLNGSGDTLKCKD